MAVSCGVVVVVMVVVVVAVLLLLLLLLLLLFLLLALELVLMLVLLVVILGLCDGRGCFRRPRRRSSGPCHSWDPGPQVPTNRKALPEPEALRGLGAPR